MTQISDKAVESLTESSWEVLREVLREGARTLLAEAVEQEVADYLQERESLRDAWRHRLVARTGHLPERTIQTGLDDVTVKRLRVPGRRPAEDREHFESSIVPRYLRRTKSVEVSCPSWMMTAPWLCRNHAFTLFCGAPNTK